MSNHPRHLIDVDDLDDSAIETLLERACELASGAAPAHVAASVVNLFAEPSTRTRVSFELAARRLGMDVVNVDSAGSSAVKGESLADTLATVSAMGVDVVVMRQSGNGRMRELLDVPGSRPSLVNAGEGSVSHPSQALLDAATLKARGIEFSGLRVAIVGDVAHSRVAASGLRLWPRLGVSDIRVAGPTDLLPPEAPAGVEVCRDLDRAVADADVVMMLRVQRERIDQDQWPDPGDYFARWGLTRDHLEKAAPGCVVMHPGPINRGVEIDADVADGPQSLILDQVRMGVFMRMAIFEWVLGLPRSRRDAT